MDLRCKVAMSAVGRAVTRGIVVAVVVGGMAACATRAEFVPPPEGPPRARLEAATEPQPPVTALTERQADGLALASASLATQEVRPPGTSPLAGDARACPPAMVLVEGEYCPDVRETCLDWEDPPANKLARCARFGPSTCLGERVHKRVCVDQDEYVPAGQTLPLSDVSWTQAGEVCQQQGKRLCLETEWEFACGGEQMLPYPTGYDRDPKLCNFDRDPLLDRKGKLLDLREAEGDLDRCVSPFGVRNMSGNVDEWVVRDRTWGEWRSALKGGWWMPARDRCRPATTAHDEHFHQLQTGVRCCADPG